MSHKNEGSVICIVLCQVIGLKLTNVCTYLYLGENEV